MNLSKLNFEIDETWQSFQNIIFYILKNKYFIIKTQIVGVLLGIFLSHFFPSEYISDARINIGYSEVDKYTAASNFLDLYIYSINNTKFDDNKNIKYSSIKNIYVNKLNNEISISVINTDSILSKQYANEIGDEIIDLITNKINLKIEKLNMDNILMIKNRESLQIIINQLRSYQKEIYTNQLTVYYLFSELHKIDNQIKENNEKLATYKDLRVGYISKPSNANLILRTSIVFKILSSMFISLIISALFIKMKRVNFS